MKSKIWPRRPRGSQKGLSKFFLEATKKVFLSALPWFKKCIFWKNSLSPFWDPRGQEAIFEVAEAKFWISSIFNGFSFRIFVILSFEVVWPQRPQKGLRDFFQKLHFRNQCVPTKKMRYVTASWSKFSLNLSTEEVWAGIPNPHLS